MHFSALRHPCVGDLTYGADPVLAARLGLQRQWLHAVRLGFEHPGTGEPVEFESPYPAGPADRTGPRQRLTGRSTARPPPTGVRRPWTRRRDGAAAAPTGGDRGASATRDDTRGRSRAVVPRA